MNLKKRGGGIIKMHNIYPWAPWRPSGSQKCSIFFETVHGPSTGPTITPRSPPWLPSSQTMRPSGSQTCCWDPVDNPLPMQPSGEFFFKNRRDNHPTGPTITLPEGLRGGTIRVHDHWPRGQEEITIAYSHYHSRIQHFTEEGGSFIDFF